jgi:NAD(P)-dependent dehydrogenase (short-subunit alcohol dehydrogenase family)
MTPLPSIQAVYWQFNQVWNARDLTVAAFADSLWGTLQRSQAHTLIIDVRLNNGGNAMLTKPLLEMVNAFTRGDATRRVFVISGRGTFSAAQIFLARLERHANVIFVGEPSSSSPNFVGEDGERIRLPYSGVMVNISFKRHQEANDDDRRQWIPVRLPIALTSTEYFANRDAAMEAIAEILKREVR